MRCDNTERKKYEFIIVTVPALGTRHSIFVMFLEICFRVSMWSTAKSWRDSASCALDSRELHRHTAHSADSWRFNCVTNFHAIWCMLCVCVAFHSAMRIGRELRHNKRIAETTKRRVYVNETITIMFQLHHIVLRLLLINSRKVGMKNPTLGLTFLFHIRFDLASCRARRQSQHLSKHWDDIDWNGRKRRNVDTQ